jgi:hypothetical protein
MSVSLFGGQTVAQNRVEIANGVLSVRDVGHRLRPAWTSVLRVYWSETENSASPKDAAM